MGMVGVAPGTTTIQLPSGQVIQITDWIDDKHYASGQFQTASSSPIIIFSSGKSQTLVGGARPQLRTDANIPRNGDSGLPKDWEFLVYAMCVELIRATRTSGSNTNPLNTDFSDPVAFKTWFNMNRSLFFEYKYNGKVYAEGIMMDFPGGAGAFWQGSGTGVEVVANGVPSPRDRTALVLPLDEKENLGYSMTVTPETALSFSQTASDNGTALTFVDMRVKKYGLIKRNVT